MSQPTPDLAGRSPLEIIEWAVATHGPRLMTTTAFGYSGMALLHMLARVERSVPVFFIDTGYHFAETLRFRDFCRDELGLNIIDLRPEQPRERFEAEHGADIMQRQPDFCCARNKVAPLARLLEQRRYDGWLVALRRDQARTRAAIQPVEPQPDGMVKIHPLAEWTRDDVWAYIRQHNVPTHPLHEEGYLSIGCAPCTRPVAAGQHEREGRWAGQGKTECGIHLLNHPAPPQDRLE